MEDETELGVDVGFVVVVGVRVGSVSRENVVIELMLEHKLVAN